MLCFPGAKCDEAHHHHDYDPHQQGCEPHHYGSANEEGFVVRTYTAARDTRPPLFFFSWLAAGKQASKHRLFELTISCAVI